MLTRLPLRLRIALIFAGLAGGLLILTGLALWLAYSRFDARGVAGALDPLLQAGLVMGFGALGLSVGIWFLFDRHVARPIEALAGGLRTGQKPDPSAARYLADLGPAARDAAALQVQMADMLAEQTAELKQEKSALEAILADFGAGALMTDATGRVVFYNALAARLLPGLMLDRPLERYLNLPAFDQDKPMARDLICVTRTGMRLSGWVRRLDRGMLLVLPSQRIRQGGCAAGLTYDFALARRGESSRLADLTCVVFDTETTGLGPDDRIVQIAGLRIARGRLTGERFETLVNPGCPIPPASTAIHRISDEMVADAPDLTRALAAFHHFAEDAVLVAHNAPFDMDLLRRATAGTGVAFDNRVLDTVLLSAMLWGNSAPHLLDALCARLGVAIAPEDRHSAMGDARATAQVFLRLIPALEAKGIGRFEDVIREARKHRRLIADANGGD